MNNSIPNGYQAPSVNAPATAAEPYPLVPWGWLRCVLFLLAYVVLSVVLAVVLVIVFGAKSEGEINAMMTTTSGVAVQFLTLVTTVLLVWLFRAVLDRQSMVSLGFAFGSRERRDLVAGMLWGVGLIGLVFLVLLASGQITPKSVAFPVEALLIQTALGVMVALTEEIMTRGYLLNNLMQSAHKYLALLLVSVLFAAFHGFNPNLSSAGLINIILAGLLLGVYYVHRRNLWFPIGLHFTWNLFQGAVFGSPVSGIKFGSIVSFEPSGHESLTGGDFGFEGSLVTTAVMILAIVWIHFKYRSGAETSEQRLAQKTLSEGRPPV